MRLAALAVLFAALLAGGAGAQTVVLEQVRSWPVDGPQGLTRDAGGAVVVVARKGQRVLAQAGAGFATRQALGLTAIDAALTSDGDLWVTEIANGRVLRYPAAGGNPDAYWSMPGAHGIAAGPDDSVYVTEWNGAASRVHRIAPDGTRSSWGVGGTAADVAVAPDGTVYVAVTGLSLVRRYTATGQHLGDWTFGSGPLGITISGGVAYTALPEEGRVVALALAGGLVGIYTGMDRPHDVVIDEGLLYVSEMLNDRLRAFRVPPPTLTLQEVASWSPVGGGGAPGAHGLALAADGVPYAAARYGNAIYRFGGSAWALQRDLGYMPIDLAVPPSGDFWATDYFGGRVVRYTPSGEVVAHGGMDGPHGVAVGPDATAWVSEWGGGRLHRIAPDGARAILPIGGAGPDVEVDEQGIVYVSRIGPNAIRRFTSDGRIIGDWPLEAEPMGLALAGDRLYVAERNPDRIEVLSLTGERQALLTGVTGPHDVAVAGNRLLVSELGQDRLRAFALPADEAPPRVARPVPGGVTANCEGVQAPQVDLQVLSWGPAGCPQVTTTADGKWAVWGDPVGPMSIRFNGFVFNAAALQVAWRRNRPAGPGRDDAFLAVAGRALMPSGAVLELGDDEKPAEVALTPRDPSVPTRMGGILWLDTGGPLPPIPKQAMRGGWVGRGVQTATPAVATSRRATARATRFPRAVRAAFRRAAPKRAKARPRALAAARRAPTATASQADSGRWLMASLSRPALGLSDQVTVTAFSWGNDVPALDMFVKRDSALNGSQDRLRFRQLCLAAEPLSSGRRPCALDGGVPAATEACAGPDTGQWRGNGTFVTESAYDMEWDVRVRADANAITRLRAERSIWGGAMADQMRLGGAMDLCRTPDGRPQLKGRVELGFGWDLPRGNATLRGAATYPAYGKYSMTIEDGTLDWFGYDGLFGRQGIGAVRAFYWSPAKNDLQTPRHYTECPQLNYGQTSACRPYPGGRIIGPGARGSGEYTGFGYSQVPEGKQTLDLIVPFGMGFGGGRMIGHTTVYGAYSNGKLDMTAHMRQCDGRIDVPWEIEPATKPTNCWPAPVYGWATFEGWWGRGWPAWIGPDHWGQPEAFITNLGVFYCIHTGRQGGNYDGLAMGWARRSVDIAWTNCHRLGYMRNLG